MSLSFIIFNQMSTTKYTHRARFHCSLLMRSQNILYFFFLQSLYEGRSRTYTHIHACWPTHTCSFVKYISCLHQSPVVSRGQTHQQQYHDKRFDLLSDLGGDIFAAPPNMNAGASSSFANFAHFNSHTSKEQTKKWLSNRGKKHIESSVWSVVFEF